MADCKYLKSWEEKVRYAALLAVRFEYREFPGPVEVRLDFLFERPKSHFKRGQLQGGAPNAKECVTRGRYDIDKLTRAVLDGLTGVVYTDDSQVVRIVARKLWCGRSDVEGVKVEVDTSV
jgi:crossover junction endodeoxyribonuclease RusA